MNAWIPSVAAGGVLIAAYLLALHQRPPTRPPWPRWRTAIWIVGALTVAAALTPQLVAAAVLDHRAHMVQHLLLGMYAPLALVAAAPVTLLLGSLPTRAGRRLTGMSRSSVARVVTHPVTAATLNIGGMFLLYLTPLHERATASPGLTALVLVHFLLAGWLYTWTIAGPAHSPHRLGVGTRLVVLVLAAGAHAYLAKLLYARAVGHPHHDHAMANAAAGAEVMYYGGDVAELLLAAMVLGDWYRRTRPRGVRTAVG